jgi:hypothetical protein
MREVFEEDFTMFQKQSIDEYIINFLKGRGNALLKGNPDVLERLDAYTNRKAKEFTKKIVNLQNLKMADAAWANKDYAGFIKYINLIDHSSLQESYIKKYKIAKSKVRQEDN